MALEGAFLKLQDRANEFLITCLSIANTLELMNTGNKPEGCKPIVVYINILSRGIRVIG